MEEDNTAKRIWEVISAGLNLEQEPATKMGKLLQFPVNPATKRLKEDEEWLEKSQTAKALREVGYAI